MRRPSRKRGSSFLTSRAWIAASPTAAETRVLARRLVKRFGQRPVAFLLSVPEFVLQRWCGEKCRCKPNERRLVWIVYAVMMHPELIRSPFDILTSGRYVAKRFGGPVSFRVGDESADWLPWCWEI